MAPLRGENSSYALTFTGPFVQCSSQTPTKSTIIDDDADRNNVVVYNGTWPRRAVLAFEWDSLDGQGDISDNQAVFNLTQRRVVGYYPAPILLWRNCSEETQSCLSQSLPDLDMPVTMVFEEQALQCEPYNTTYSVKISYIKGIQRIEYTTDNAERLHHKYQIDSSWIGNGSSTMPTDTEEYKRWESQFPSWKEKANSRAILDSVGYNLEYQWSQAFSRNYNNITETYVLPNGTETALGDMEGLEPEFFLGNSKKREVFCRTNADNLTIRLHDPARQRTQYRTLWTQCILWFRSTHVSQHHRSLHQRTPRQRYHLRPLSKHMVRQR
jgi:hypothetical protein